MNIEWIYRNMIRVPGFSYEVYALMVNGICEGEIFRNSKARRERYGEPEWEVYIFGVDEDEPVPDTIKTIEDAKAYALAMWRLQS